MDRLAPCSECGRHVRVTEPACPFCGGAVGAAPAARPRGRLGRAAIFAFGAALASASCSDSHRPDDDAGAARDAGTDTGAVAPPYGTPPDDGGIAPLYGGAPPGG